MAGATNLVMGLADAMMDSVPLVAINGQVRGWGCGLWWDHGNGVSACQWLAPRTW